MFTSRTTALVIVAAIVLLILYDLIVYAVGGDNPTISRTLLWVSKRSGGFALAVCFALGVLVGHLFLPQRPRDDEGPTRDKEEGGA